MANLQTISHKRGTTFSYGGLVKLPAGTWTARASVQTQTWQPVSDLVANGVNTVQLTFGTAPTSGQYRVTVVG